MILKLSLLGVVCTLTATVALRLHPMSKKRSSSSLEMETKQVIDTGGAKLGPYNPCVCVGSQIWVSGQIGIDAPEKTVKAQVESILGKLDALLEKAGSSKADLVFVTVLLADMEYFAEFNTMYAAWLEGTTYPTRACYACKALPGGALVEVAVQAVKGSAP